MCDEFDEMLIGKAVLYFKYHYLSDIILTKIFFYRYVTKNRIITANKSTKIGKQVGLFIYEYLHKELFIFKQKQDDHVQEKEQSELG